ncbi:MAG: bifunctional demethylmenaquinone methyltransferase/2-methoxy-6-polyprenyl-1,4-benzoquinol methylase UbiE [Thermodesulfobacteriota bacterium]
MTEEEKTHFGNQLVDFGDKKNLVKDVFDSVANKYDFMNDLMSFGTHRLWKRFLKTRTGLRPGQSAIDVAGGTADIAMLMAESVGEEGSVTVYDINFDMIALGRDKAVDKGFLKNLRYTQGDAEFISFADNSFHAATIGFGIRNVTDIPKAISEMTRVVKPGGRVICLEFSHPVDKNFSKLYDLYSFNVIPVIGELITKNRDAYIYLAESIRKFPPQEEFKRIMEEAGLFKVSYINLFGGIAALHTGYKV